MPRIVFALGLVLAVSACSSGSSTTARLPSSTTTTTAAATATTTPTTANRSSAESLPSATLRCSDVIGTTDTPPPTAVVVLDRVVLPTRLVTVASSGERSPFASLFAKQGLLIRPNTPFDLIVPGPYRARLSIGWGNPAQRTAHLIVPACPPSPSGAHWLAFAGGFWTARRQCVALTVKIGSREQTVRIGIGATCPTP